MELSKFLVLFVYALLFSPFWCKIHFYDFKVEEVPYTRLCSTKKIMTVNGQFPGPTLYAHRGDTIVVKVRNKSSQNITIHWHGVKQPRNPWSDGPEHITQCAITPGSFFTYTVILSTEEGTVWWHAHSDFTRATVHGAIVVYPSYGDTYPFTTPDDEFVIVLGEWWKEDVNAVLEDALITGGEFAISDAYTINGQPGDLYSCSSAETFRMVVDYGKTYLLRVVNAGMSNGFFFSIAGHSITVVGSDGSYTKPLTTNYIMISPGETMDLLLHANQISRHTNLYYMAAQPFSSLSLDNVDNTTTTAIIEYNSYSTPNPNITPLLASLHSYNDTEAANKFVFSLKSLADTEHQTDIPTTIDKYILITVSVNEVPCPHKSCDGPNGTQLLSSLNNISFVEPESTDILQAYYYGIDGVFNANFPDIPPFFYNFTADDQPAEFLSPKLDTSVKVLDYGVGVEVVFQGTSLVAADSHPMHLHGYNFYIVGWGLGNFDAENDPLKYNLCDPPLKNSVALPTNGWVAIRFTADNPGVWYMHCHLERHLVWGMNSVFIVRDGKRRNQKLRIPPYHMPKC